MVDQEGPQEDCDRTWSRTRQSQGGLGCCGCCLGALLIGAVATFAGLSLLYAGTRQFISGLDQEQRLGLALVIGLTFAAFAVVAWRVRPRLKRRTTVITRVSRAVRTPPAETGENPAVLDAEWRPADASGSEPAERALGEGSEDADRSEAGEP